MEVILTEKLDVKPIDIEFEVWITFNNKRGVDKDYWFTPSGKCKVRVYCLHTRHLGKLGEGQHSKLMKMMKKAKCDVLTDGSNYYTTGDNNLIELANMSTILYQAKDEWDKRKFVEYWVEDDRKF